MKLSLLMMNSTREILSGFNGTTNTKLRDIRLPVQAGPVSYQFLFSVVEDSYQFFFSVVEDLGPYNFIVGRNWLHSMKVVPSTYHQMVSYLTNTGQVDLLRSQLAVRQCYQLSIWERRKKKGLDGLPLRDHLPT